MRKLSKKQVNSMIDLLERAHTCIYINRQGYVCEALNFAHARLHGCYGWEVPPNTFDLTYLERWIRSMLKGSSSLDDWIKKRYSGHSWEPNNGIPNRMCITRLLWIEWMIEHLKETT